jgi:hypothetical protein
MPLEDLDGRETSRGRLRLGEVERGRFPEERNAVIYLDDSPVIRLKRFAGRRSAAVNPWIEATLVEAEEPFAAELVQALAELLPPGGYLMVGYGDDETERGLKRRFPAVATPLGKALFDAGATWFKDWYYPEGWMEGGMKLQGNKPVSDDARDAHLREIKAELQQWLERVAGSDDELLRRALARAEAVLKA